MHPARARLTALALLAVVAAGTSAVDAVRAHRDAVVRPGSTRSTAHIGGPCRRSGAGRCPPAAPGSPATTLAEPGYVPEPAGPPQPSTAAARR